MESLRKIPAKIRFLSMEPLLGPLPSLNLKGINWVIVGGESGPGARPIKEEWVGDRKDKLHESFRPYAT
jgi:protein gp37